MNIPNDPDNNSGCEEISNESMAERIYQGLLAGRLDASQVEINLRDLYEIIPNDYCVLMGLFCCAEASGNAEKMDLMSRKLTEHHSDKPDVCLLRADNLINSAFRKITIGKGRKKRRKLQYRIQAYRDATELLATRSYILEQRGECGMDMEAIDRIGIMRADGFEAHQSNDEIRMAMANRPPRSIQGISSLIKKRDFDAARKAVHLLLSNGGKENAVQGYKFLFEIACREGNFDKAHVAFQFLAKRLHTTEIIPFKARLVRLQDSPRNCPYDRTVGQCRNRVWDTLATSNPVDRTACAVAGNGSVQPKNGSGKSQGEVTVTIGNGFVRRRKERV